MMKLFGKELTKETTVVIIVIPVISLLVSLGIISGDVGVLGNVLVLSAFIIAIPLFMLRYEKYREIKEMEEKFPNFLRDLVENLRSGVPFHKSVAATARLDYGRLNLETRKMANQISWGMTLDRVLDQFADRVKASRRMFSSIRIIRESYLSGGDVTSILDSVADNVTILDDTEKEKRSLLSQYVLMMYAISFVFLGIVVAINRLLIPIFQATEIQAVGEQLGLINPCFSCADFTCGVCGLFEGTSQYIFSLDPAKISSYYTSLFFFMAIIQSLFSGLVAGQISESSIMAGVKHSVILVSAIFGAFSIMVKLGILGI